MEAEYKFKRTMLSKWPTAQEMPVNNRKRRIPSMFSKLGFTKMNLVSINDLHRSQQAREERKETRGRKGD